MRALLCFVTIPLLAQTIDRPIRAVTDPGVVTTRQTITPAGVPTVFQGRVYGVRFGASASEVWVLHASQLYRLDWAANRVVSLQPHGGSPGLQGIVMHNGQALATVAQKRQVALVRGGNKMEVLAEKLGSQLAGAPGIGGDRILIPITAANQAVLLDASSGARQATIETAKVPFAAVLSSDGKTAWISNWGGRIPGQTDLTAPTGLEKDSDRVVVDQRGIAASGTVSRVDLEARKITAEVAVGLHPTALAWDEARQRLYVANTNHDSVSIVDTAAAKLVRTIALQPFAQKAAGIAPTALALAKDGKTLYVACGGINAVLVLDAATGAQQGMIPTAWYPNALDLSPDGRYLAVGALLGAGSGWRDAPAKRFVHSYRGSVHIVALPDAAQLASYTTTVAENNRLSLTAAPVRPVLSRTPKAIPQRAGEPSFIEHVVYIIKENRTYDQLFGDLGKGNGDPSLVLFGADVTPNQRRLAEQFVLLDNFYATGGNSADGHQWVTQANETAYCLWPGYTGRSYPFDGTDPLAYSASGFLWDLALARGKTVRVYGEYAGRLPEPASRRFEYLDRWRDGGDFSKEWNITAPIASLNKILAPQFPPYTNAIPDVVRAQIFLKDFRQWERDGRMPNLTIMLLPSDHTYGTSPGATTPKAMVADNDYAVGQIVEALSHSRFWPRMAIFIVEDDAQNGVDHVDGHRTVALAVSPYTRRGHIDSTFYSHQSMVKTIELILGLPTMSLFDLIAHDMRASFSDTPDPGAYDAVRPKQDFWEKNPPASALRGEARRAALASARFRWDVPDAAPSRELNRILWHSIKGWKTPYPGVKRAVFAPLEVGEEEGEERREKADGRSR